MRESQNNRSDSKETQSTIPQCSARALSANEKRLLRLRAEIRHILHVCEFSSLNSCSHTGGSKNLYATMFPNDTVAKTFAVGRTKAAYVIEEAIAPYLRQKQMSFLQDNLFVIIVDESNNVKGKKQLDILVRYFIESVGIVTEFYRSIFLKIDPDEILRVLSQSDCKDFPSICSAEKLSSEILECIESDNIPLSNIVAVNRDGPNVMKATLTKLKRKMPHLIDIGSCNLHGVHNAASKAVQEFSISPSEVILAIQKFFHDQALRREEINVISNLFDGSDNVNLGSFGGTRFLSLHASIEKILENYAILKTYFLHFLTKKSTSVTSNVRFQKICEHLSDPYVEAMFLFLKEALGIIKECELFLQKQEPIGPMFYDMVINLFATILGRCCSTETSEKVRKGKMKILFNFERFVEKKPYLGAARMLLIDLHRDTELKKLQYEAKNFYISLVQNLIHYFHFDDEKTRDLWESMSALSMEARKKENTNATVKKFDKLLDILMKSKIIQASDCAIIRDEFVKFLSDEEAKEVFTRMASHRTGVQLDLFYSEALQLRTAAGLPRYVKLPKYIFMLLCIQPHSADVERNFSINSRILTNETNRMSSKMLNDRKRICCHLKNIGGCTNMVITNELCEMAASAHKRLKERREKEKRTRERREILKRNQKILARKRSIRTEKANRFEEEATHCERICTTSLRMALKCLKKAKANRRDARAQKMKSRGLRIDHYTIDRQDDASSEMEDLPHFEQRNVESSEPVTKKRKITDYFAKR